MRVQRLANDGFAAQEYTQAAFAMLHALVAVLVPQFTPVHHQVLVVPQAVFPLSDHAVYVPAEHARAVELLQTAFTAGGVIQSTPVYPPVHENPQFAASLTQAWLTLTGVPVVVVHVEPLQAGREAEQELLNAAQEALALQLHVNCDERVVIDRERPSLQRFAGGIAAEEAYVPQSAVPQVVEHV